MAGLSARGLTVTVALSDAGLSAVEQSSWQLSQSALTVPILVVSWVIPVTSWVQVIASPAARALFGHVTVKSSPVLPGVPLSSVTTTSKIGTLPVLVTTYV